MHELSIVNALVRLCEDNAKAHNAKKIIKVEVKIGRLSGIEPHFFKTTFETFKEKTICDGSQLIMNIQEVIIKCNICKTDSYLIKNEFLCPSCKSSDIKVIDGEDMVLMKLEME